MLISSMIPIAVGPAPIRLTWPTPQRALRIMLRFNGWRSGRFGVSKPDGTWLPPLGAKR